MARRRWGKKEPTSNYPFVWDRSVKPKGYKGQRCRIVSGKKSEVCQVEFRNGRRFHVVRSGLKRADA